VILRLRKPLVNAGTAVGAGKEDEAGENVGQDDGGGDGDREEEEKCESGCNDGDWSQWGELE
jgi:hypothetical protein